MFAEMADATLPQAPPTPPRPDPVPQRARAALARFERLSADVRGAAIVAPGGSVIAASGDEGRWRAAAGDLLRAADAAVGSASQVHVATEEGEVYAVRLRGLGMVAVSERFALASLVLSDMRAALREVAGAIGGPG